MKPAMGVLSVLAAVTAAGCSYQDGDGQTKTIFDRSIKPHYVPLPNGGQVLCIWEKDGYGGGLSCDWQGVQR